MKPRASIFLDAAKRLHARSLKKGRASDGLSAFACDCIGFAVSKDPIFVAADTPEQDFFSSYFRPSWKERCDDLGWWETGDYQRNYAGHDYESRLIALLLCWVMLNSSK